MPFPVTLLSRATLDACRPRSCTSYFHYKCQAWPGLGCRSGALEARLGCASRPASESPARAATIAVLRWLSFVLPESGLSDRW